MHYIQSKRELILAFPNFIIYVLDRDGLITPQEIETALIGQTVPLPYAPNKYFKLEKDTQFVRLSKIVHSRARANGIKKAAKYMEAAYNGQHSKRAPIDVYKFSCNKFLVLDGNSTAIVAYIAGWPDVPVKLLID